MKNVKLTLATTLSILALSFSGAALADGERGSRFNNHKQKNMVVKSTVSKHSNRHEARNKKVVKRVVVKHTPTKKIVITKTFIKKPSKARYAKNKRFQHVKRFNKQYRQYQNRTRYENRFNNKRTLRQSIYSVRSGDTLIQISYKTGVSIKKLARLNRIKNRNLNYLKVGQILKLV